LGRFLRTTMRRSPSTLHVHHHDDNTAMSRRSH
jgi:hypothetical protein